VVAAPESARSTSGPTLSNDPLVGQYVDARYRIERFLARGGMATVYLATDERLHRQVAVKIMHASLAEDPEFVSRFQREARAAASLSHPNVVAVHDQGQDGDPARGGLVWLIMEYIQGRTVRDVLRERGPLTASQALVVLEPVLEALSAAHAKGFVHRDMKPENVLISDDGRVKVTDFGLARAITASNQTASAAGMLIGTVAYLSPEQVEQGRADARSDVYGTGILLYELLTGSTPFAGQTPLSIAYQHVNASVPAPSARDARIPSIADSLVLQATARNPADRYADAASFLTAVRSARAALPAPTPLREHYAATSATTQVVSSTWTPPQPTSTLPALEAQATKPPRKRRTGLILTLLLLAVTVAIFLAGWYVSASRYVAVPSVLGQSATTATETLGQVELELEPAGTEFSETAPKNAVLRMSPDPGASVVRGSKIQVVLSSGPERYTVPTVVGMTETAAADALAKSLLVIAGKSKAYNETVPTGQVVSATPAAGTPLKKGSGVTLVISQGPKPVEVPDVVDTPVETATSTLEALGFTVKTTKKYSEQVREGRVISMTPKPGATEPRGSQINLVVSQGPPPVTVPNVVGDNGDDAVSQLRRAGLKVRTESRLGVVVINRVLSQSINGGASVPRGTTVVLTLV